MDLDLTKSGSFLVTMSRNFSVLIVAITALSICQTLNGQSIVINSGQYQIDRTQRLVVCNQIPHSLSVPISSIQLDHLYTFASSVNSLSTDQFYSIVYNDTTYQLSFSRFPIVKITTNGVTIVKEIVSKASIVISDTNGVSHPSFIGINVRGGVSSTFPKKSYKIDFLTDTLSLTPKDTTLFGMRTDSEWLLLAMYNEALRLNNVTSHALWRTMHQLYYLNQEPDALSGIRTQYVDVFIDGNYTGIYALTESIDRKQLKLKKTKDNGQPRGELYKSSDWTAATLFTSLPPNNGNDSTWAGYELKYPNQPGFWENLYSLVDFSVNSTDATFKNQLSAKWQIDNLIDYFLFLNLTRATDNQGKNLYVARYKEGEPYFIVAWDLDGTWGTIWSGSHENTTNDILTNGLFNRLLSLNPANFQQKLKARWFSLRTNLFSTTALKNNIVSNATLLTNNGAYLREAIKWPVGSVNAELTYATNWIDNRVAFLDSYFGSFLDLCTNPVAPTLSVNSSTITAGMSAILTASGCPYTVYWNTGQLGANLTVNPWQTAQYWAICNQVGAGCQSPESTTITLTVLPDDHFKTVQADLSLGQHSDSRVIAVNKTARLTLSLTNHGPVTARTIQLQDRLPAGLSFAGNANPSVTYLNGVVNISLDSLDVYQTALFSFDVSPTSSGLFRNTAQLISSASYDPDSTPGSGTADGEDDMATAEIRTLTSSTLIAESPNPNQRPLPSVLSNQPDPDPAKADLSLHIELDKLVVKQGSTNTVKMSVRNAGGLTATGVTVLCVLPSGVQHVTGSGGTASGNTVSVTGLTIESGGTTTVTFTVTAINSGSWIYQGQIAASDQSDSDSTPGNGTINGEDDEAWEVVRVN